MKALAAVIGVLVLVAIGSIWYGYVLSIIWGWFIAPTFNAPRLNIPAAIGVSSAIRLITWQHSESEDEKKPLGERVTQNIIRGFAITTATLFLCWIVKHWM